MGAAAPVRPCAGGPRRGRVGRRGRRPGWSMTFLEDYRRAMLAGDFARAGALAADLLACETIALPHPDRPAVTTTVRASRRERLGNLLFLADAAGGNRWCLIQGMNFADGYVTEAGARTLFDPKTEDLVAHVARRLADPAVAAAWDRADAFGGIRIGQTRPYHFFYDQAIHLAGLRDRLPAAARRLAADADCYLDPQAICGWAAEPVRPDRYYLTPNLVGGTWWRHADAPGFLAAASRMEAAIRAAVPPAGIVWPEGSLVLWIGITGQKRSWLDQVEGHAAIANALARLHPTLVLLIDGMTAPHGRRTLHVEDDLVAEAIRRRLAPNVLAVPLIGADYATKIAYGHGAHAFIANGGSGSLTPLRFCGLPGVLHSNDAIRTFEGDRYPQEVHFVDSAWVREVPHPENPRGDWVSYRIPWQHIHNLLAGILARRGLAAPAPLAVPPVESLPPGDFERFGGISRRFGSTATSAQILRGLAGLFAERKDHRTAAALLEQALQLDPSDQVIRQFLTQRQRAER